MTDDRSSRRSFIGRTARFLRHEGHRVGVGIVGGAVVVVGIVLMPLPGPGLLVVLAGLALLATRFDWARQLLDGLRERARNVLDRWRDEDGPSGGDHAEAQRPDLGTEPLDDRSDVA